ncbi:MAG: murein biosynthesis integral membrane protein MurJ [Candidatus Eisenbacteria bacterium]
MTTPAGERPAADAAATRTARAAGKVGAATLLSRVLGLARDQVMAAMFGAGFASDAFNTAFRVPNLLRDLFAEGAMSASFIPTFTEYEQKRGKEEAWALGRQLMSTLLVVLGVLCAIGAVFAPQLMHLLAAGFAEQPGKLELTASLFRIMLPFLPLVALAAAAMGMLNASGVFGVPALAPALLNVGMIVFGLALVPVCGRFGVPAVVAMAFGVVGGAALQFAIQLPSLRRLGFTLRFERPTWHPGVRRVALLMVPATIGLAATNVNIFVSNNLASHMEQGAVTWLYCAFRLMQLPIGVFGIALATVAMPALSRAAVRQDLPELKRTLATAVRMVLLLTIPAAVYLAVMAKPIIALLFQHGRFSALATDRTAAALVMYCVGLPCFAAIGIFTRTFYALGDTKTPMRSSLTSVAINVALNLALVGPLARLGLGHRGLALAASLAALANVSQLAFLLRGRIGGFGARGIALTLLRVAVASAVVGGAMAGLLALAGPELTHGHVRLVLTVAGSAAIALVLFWGSLRVARVEDVALFEDAFGSLARRFRR